MSPCNFQFKEIANQCISDRNATLEIPLFIEGGPNFQQSEFQVQILNPNQQIIWSHEQATNSYGHWLHNAQFKPGIEGIYKVLIVCDQMHKIEQEFKVHFEPQYQINLIQTTCHDSQDGQIILTPFRGQNLTYQWSDGNRSESRSHLAPGGYQVSITNQVGCIVVEQFFIQKKQPISVQLKTALYECNGSVDSLAALQIEGGRPPYEIDWSYDGMGDYDDQQRISSLSEGWFQLNIRDADFCEVILQVQIEYQDKKELVSKSITLDPLFRDNGLFVYDLSLTVDASYGDIDNDGQDGSIFEVTYHENETAAQLDEYPMSDMYNSDQSKIIYARVENEMGCFVISQISLAENDFCLKQSEACDNDPLLLLEPTECDAASTPLPGNGTYEIFLKVGGDLIPAPELLSCDAMNDQCFIDPTEASGNYEVLYTYEKNGTPNTRRAFFDIQEVNPQVNLDLELVCPTAPIFDIRANPVGGSLSGPGIVGNLISGSNQFYYINPEMLNPGEWNFFNYTYSQINFSGLICTKTISDSVFVSDFITVELDGTDFQSCANSEITLQASNFRGPITRLEWHDPDGLIIGTSTSVNFILEKNGDYSINVFNADGCSAGDTITINKLELPVVVCDIDASISCPNGMNATASVTLPGVTDLTGYTADWSHGATGFQQNNLGEGTYVITVTAPNGCVDSCEVDIIAPDIMEIECDHVLKPVTCFGGSDGVDSLFVKGGTPPYTYSRDNIIFQSSPVFDDVSGGFNRFYIRDANDCLDSCDFQMPEPPRFDCTSETIGSISCMGESNGMITIDPVGGVPPYTYLWSNGATTKSISNLSAGTYSVVTSDAIGCTCSNSFTLQDPPQLAVNITNDTVSCFDGSDGQLQANISGGTPPFFIMWSNGLTTSRISNLSAGTYMVEVRDRNGCIAMANASVVNPIALNLTCDDDLLACAGDQNGQLSVSVTGGEMPYTYRWANGQTASSAQNLGAGDHKVIVTDAKGCQDSCFGTISEPLPIQIDLERDSVCLDFKSTITSMVTGGIGNFEHTWSIKDDGGTGATMVNLENPLEPNLSFNSFCLKPGTVTLELNVEDMNGCVVTEEVPFVIHCCFDLAIKKTIEKSSDYVPGEIAEFDIEVFNQGEVDAFDVKITDSTQTGMTMLAVENTSALTGNEYDWIPNKIGILETQIDFIAAGTSKKLKALVRIDDDFEGYELINYTEIVFYTNGLKDNPMDEDDFIPGLHPRLEKNNDVDDDRNGQTDNPNDEDKKDFEPIFLCSDQPFACNDHVQVSLDENGEAIITPDMVGEGLVSEAFIEIIIKDENKKVLGDTLNCSHIGQQLEFSIYNICTDVTCWGNLTVEDKMAPTVKCARPDTLFCHQKMSSFRPDTVRDNCGIWTGKIASDHMEKYPCDSIFSGKRTITRIYTDQYGNQSKPCIYTIFYQRYSAVDVDWPHDTIIPCLDFINADPQQVGVPKVNGIPVYPMALGCSLALKYKDDTLRSCGATFKIIRRWTALDWCPITGVENPFFYVQVIKTIDQKEPVIYCPGTDAQVDTFSSDNQCRGTFILPEPHRLLPGQPIIDSSTIYVISECSEFTYSVLHVPANDPNDCTPSHVPANANQVRLLPDGRYEAFDLPYGCNWFYYTIQDDCGNKTECTFDIFVKDMMPPVAVCDQHTVVSLNLSGRAELPARSVDDGSQDNCAIDTMLIRRMDGTPCGGPQGLQEKAIFCCQDVGKTIMVEFVVFDKSGNSNSCMVEVMVQNKTRPVVDFCPKDITIDCLSDYRDTSLTGGSARFSGVCPVRVTFRDFPNLNDCGVGTIRREWMADDSLGGQKGTCTQIITLQDMDPINDANIMWPDTTVELFRSCDLSADPDITGRPQLLAKGCHDELMTFADQVLSHGIGSCIKILRLWTVVDWCTFDLTTGAGEWTFEQTIVIRNQVAPRLICRDTLIPVITDQCSANVTVIGRGSDDCTPAEDLDWLIKVDLFNDGSIDASDVNNSLDVTMPLGIHKVTFAVKDGCGNDQLCTEIWTVEDRKRPSPVCKPALTSVTMANSGAIDIWASDINDKSFDNCTSEGDLIFSFSSDIFDVNRSYDCSDIKNGISDTVEVELWVTDENGNQDYCRTTIILQDNLNDVCPDQMTGNTVKGKITSVNGFDMENVSVTCTHSMTGATIQSETNDQGQFEFNQVAHGQEFRFSSNKTGDWLEGISTKDLILIQQHLLGKKQFQFGSQYFAADVTNDQSISAKDIVTLRKLLLGKIDAFPNGQSSWRFIDDAFVFDMINPFEAIETISHMSGSGKNVNFTGIKIGDIDESYAPLNVLQTRSELEVNVYWQETDRGWILYSADEIDLEGFQLALSVDDVIKLRSETLPLNEGNYQQTNDHVYISWNGMEANNISPDEMLLEIITPQSHPPKMVVNYNNEFYNRKLESLRPQVVASPEKVYFTLFQNIPNPFDKSTVIPFDLKEGSNIELSVFASDGQAIYQIEGYYSKGDHQLTLSASDLQSSGVMYYRLKVNDQVEIRKMIRL